MTGSSNFEFYYIEMCDVLTEMLSYALTLSSDKTFIKIAFQSCVDH